MVTLADLVRASGPALQPVNAAARAPIELTGVHISELIDPTRYLEGGELLLTTGMPLLDPAVAVPDYIERLVDRDVRVLVIGLGPNYDEVPAALREACDAAGMPLLLVPVDQAFRTVTTKYWELVAAEGRAGLVQQIGLQTSVVRAAAGANGVDAVVKSVAQAMGSWAMAAPFEGPEVSIWPASAAGVLPALRTELQRFAQRGSIGAATFPLHGFDVIAYPITEGSRPVGAFVVGTTRRPSKTDRQVMLTAAAALSLRATLRNDAHGSERSIDSAAGALLLDGEVSAARALRAAVGARPMPPAVRVFVPAAHVLPSTSPRAMAPPSPQAHAMVAELIRRGLIAERCNPPLAAWHAGRLVLLIDEAAGAGPSVDSKHWTPLESLSGALSDPVPLAEVPAVVRATVERARRAQAGAVLTASDAPGRSQGDVAAEALRMYSRAPLVEAVQGYIRHRGSWEAAARELGLHRNTVRNRVQIARDTLGIDLDDPDIASELWIALRDHPHG
ncbi:PucR family transcriptional regulator [Microbacterium terricola]|uniref:PucR family transcriptional regulator n=1 Tax=Microbacterium terricola TaxID=344163 RepID=A0ABM8E390_9MICO|nr:PucR family transcriptional regulator ligand-binding domain-containing protein [Microbacterium terricola]UYK40064.1 PucR family transcriptional regulator ligand-binding domain-containing protein [Microbacterium terricola]BDV32239.1 PucR family transcriptional regulator [Microbacterium terricola]